MRGRLSDDADEKVAWLLVVGTIPVAILGVLLEKPVRQLFGSPALVAVFLIVNAFVMFAGERLRRATADRAGARALALVAVVRRGEGRRFPGARALPGDLALGRLDRRRPAARSLARRRGALFVLARDAGDLRGLRPRTAAALRAGLAGMRFEAALGALLAGLTAYASVAFLTRYFHTNDLRPFGWYCLLFGALCLGLALAKVIT